MGTTINTSSSNAPQVTSEKKIKSDTKPQVASDKEVKPGAPSPTPSPSPSATPEAKTDKFIASDLLGLMSSGLKPSPSPTPSQQTINSLRGGLSNPPSPAMDSGGVSGLMDGLMNHPPIPPSPTPSPAPTPSPTMTFGESIKKLDDPVAISMMDQLEGPSGANPKNGLFGTMGMDSLSKLTPDSPEWGNFGQGNSSETDRQGFIDAAKTAMANPDQLKTVSDLDSHGFFSKKSLDQWLSKNSDGSIDDKTKQGDIGNCWTLSAARAAFTTPKGSDILKQSIKPNSDGSYDVTFKGDSNNKTYNITKEQLQKFPGSGDPDMQIIQAASDQYFMEHGKPNGIKDGGNETDAFRLYLGNSATVNTETGAAWGGTKTKDEYKQFLLDSAPKVNSGERSMTIDGNVHSTTGNIHSSVNPKSGADGNVFYAGEHAFQVQNIDTEKGLITYINPWDSSKTHVIGIDTFAADMTKKGGSADIQYADFK